MKNQKPQRDVSLVRSNSSIELLGKTYYLSQELTTHAGFNEFCFNNVLLDLQKYLQRYPSTFVDIWSKATKGSTLIHLLFGLQKLDKDFPLDFRFLLELSLAFLDKGLSPMIYKIPLFSNLEITKDLEIDESPVLKHMYKKALEGNLSPELRSVCLIVSMSPSFHIVSHATSYAEFKGSSDFVMSQLSAKGQLNLF